LCRSLIERGIPLWRVTIYAGTLHPQLRGYGWRWWRDRRATEEVRVAQGTELSAQYVESPLRKTIEQGLRLRRRLDGDLDGCPLLAQLRDQGGTDYMVAPLNQVRSRYAAVTWATDRSGGFTERDLAILEAIRPALAATIETRVLRRTARTLFSIYHSREVGERIFDGHILRGHVERLHAAILVTDLRGFTAISDQRPAEAVIEALDDYFEYVADSVHGAHGLILKFVGDGVLAIFPADTDKEARAAASALAAAREMLRRIEGRNSGKDGGSAVTLRAGVALHLGEVMYGNVGSPDRLDFTAVGPAVNLSFRLEGLTKELRQSIVTSRAFAQACPGKLRSLGHHPIRGLSEPEEVFGLAEHAGTTP